MKRIAFATVCLATVAGIGYHASPDEFTRYGDLAVKTASRAWAGVEANPVPMIFALGTFMLTVVYHKARGKSLRESVEVAATRVTVVPVPSRELDGEENPVVKRAKARSMRTQLVADQILLQNRQRKLPTEIVKVEQETCYTEQALADAEKSLAAKQKAHDEALARLEALQKENAACETELAEIDAELKKLTELV